MLYLRPASTSLARTPQSSHHHTRHVA